MEALLRERLRNLVSNTDSAFNALWMKLDQLGARMDGSRSSTAVQHRLTKHDLRNIIQQSGSTLAPPMDLVGIRHSFSSTSAIGRSWRRDIAGLRITSPIVNEILAAIDVRKDLSCLQVSWFWENMCNACIAGGIGRTCKNLFKYCTSLYSIT